MDKTTNYIYRWTKTSFGDFWFGDIHYFDKQLCAKYIYKLSHHNFFFEKIKSETFNYIR